MTDAAPIRVFVSSPGDLRRERLRIVTVCRRVARATGVRIDPILWEGGGSKNPDVEAFPPYMTGRGAQAAIDQRVWDELGGCDIYIGMIWRRPGTRTGNWRSGTEAEYRQSVKSRRTTGRPSLLLFYRKAESNARKPAQTLRQEARRRRDGFIRDLQKDGLLQPFRTATDLEGHLFGVLSDAIHRLRPSSPRADVSFWAGRPASLRSAFKGRSRDIRALKGLFNHHQVVVISGGPGTGKTRLAAEFSHSRAEPGFWTFAADDSEGSVVGLAPSLGIVSVGRRTSVTNEVQRRILSLPQEAIWIIDNLSDLDQVNKIINLVPMRILVTTRDSRASLLPPTVGFHSLRTLAKKPGAELLVSRSRWPSSDSDLSRIGERVGWLPLALEILARRLGEPLQAPGLVLKSITTLSTSVRSGVLDSAAGVSLPRGDGVVATILDALNRTPSTCRLKLPFLGYIADLPLSPRLAGTLMHVSQAQLREILRGASTQSILDVVGEAIVLHSLTVAAIRYDNRPSVLRAVVSRAKTRLIESSRKPNAALLDDLPHYRSIFDHAMATVETATADALQLGSHVAIAMQSVGRFEDAIRLDSEISSLRESLLGPDHPDTLRSLNNLAVDLRLLGQIDESIAINKKVLTRRRKVLGPNDPETMVSESNLSAGLWQAGKLKAAIRAEQIALKRRQTVLGPEHPDTLASLGNLASELSQVGQRRRSLELHKETVEGRRRALGSSHPDTLTAENNLAAAYRKDGRLKDAIALYEAVLKKRTKVLGALHPYTLATMSNLGIAYREAGRIGEATDLQERSTDGRLTVLGPDHPETLISLNNLAEAYASDNRLEEAESLHDRVYEARKQLLGRNHASTLVSLGNLAAIRDRIDEPTRSRRNL